MFLKRFQKIAATPMAAGCGVSDLVSSGGETPGGRAVCWEVSGGHGLVV